jgi:flagellar protein FlbD
MIAVTRLDGGAMVINAELIETIELTPDTLISMSNGDKLYVRESLDELVELVIRFKRAILERAAAPSAASIRGDVERPRTEDSTWQ